MLIPLSSNQEVIWLEQKLYPGGPLYNIGGYLTINGPIHPGILNQAVHRVIANNDALRIKIHEKDGQAYQEFLTQLSYNLEFKDFSHQNHPHQACMHWMACQFKDPLNMNQSPLFQLALVKEKDNRYYHFFKWHHMIIDGWGISLYCKYLARAYNQLLQQTLGPPSDRCLKV